MSSVGSFYAQRDNRVVDVPLTGYVTNNGELDTGSANPAVANLDVSYSRLFTVDTRELQARTPGGGEAFEWYLVGITFPKLAPPQFYPGFEVNIVINVKDTNVPSPYPLIFRIQKSPSVPLDYGDDTTFIEMDNVDYGNSTDLNTVYTYGERTVTLLALGSRWVVKSSYLNNGPSIV